MDDYFRKMRNLGQKIDSDLRKLEKTWETPHLFMSGYGDNVEEAVPYVERFLGTLKEIQDQLIEDRERRAKEIADSDEYLSRVDNFHQNLKQHCQEVETLLIDNGYEPIPESSERLPLMDSGAETSILTPEQMENSISSAGSLWAGNDDVLGGLGSLHDPPRSIATPVIRRLASFGESRVSSTIGTTLDEFDSPHHGSRLK